MPGVCKSDQRLSRRVVVKPPTPDQSLTSRLSNLGSGDEPRPSVQEPALNGASQKTIDNRKIVDAERQRQKAICSCIRTENAAVPDSRSGDRHIRSSSNQKENQTAPAPKRKRGRPKKHWYHRVEFHRSKCINRLKPRQVAELNVADKFAHRCGMPLDTFVTINWQLTSVLTADIPAHMRRALDAFRHWCERKSIKPAWLYVHEAPSGRFNTHILCHIGSGLRGDLTLAAQSWFKACCPNAVLVEPRRYPGHKDTRLQYMTKGTDQLTASRYHGHAKPQGDIPFRRCGTSRNLGRAAQKAAYVRL